jgi:hypothetical protein
MSSQSLLSVSIAITIAACIGRAQGLDTRINLGTSPGSANADSVSIAAAGTSVFAVWRDQRNGALSDIYYNRSLDYGETWSPADQRLCPGAPGSASSVEPRITTADGIVHVVWREFAGPAADVYYRASYDGGASFAPPLRLDLGDFTGATDSLDIEIAVEGLTVCVVWSDMRNGLSDIYCNRSLDAGLTWLPTPQRIDLGDPAGTSSSFRPAIVLRAGVALVAWEDGRNGGNGGLDVYCNQSLDGGMTWLAAEQRLDSGDAPGASRSSQIAIAAGGATIAVVWQDQRSGGNDIHANVSADLGTTWLATDVRLDLGSAPGASVSESPRVAVANGVVCAIWRDTAIPGVVNPDIHYNRSGDAGVTWLATDPRLDDGAAPSATDSRDPVLIACGNDFLAAWSEPSAGSYDILLDRSIDGGLTWLPVAVRVDTDLAGVGDSRDVALAAADGTVHAAWRNRRNSTSNRYDIYAATPRGCRRYGNGTIGTGGFVPDLVGGGTPSPGGVVTARLEYGLGGGLAVFLASLAGRAASPQPWGTLLVALPAVSTLFALSGSPGTPGAGGTQLSLSLPSHPGLLGVVFDLQAGVLDSGSVTGVAITAGLEFRIR